MPNGRPASVRSHRRGGVRRGRKTALAITIPLATMLVASGLVGGYLWVSRQACSGTASTTILSSPTTAPLLERLGRDWTATRSAVEGADNACGTVKVLAMESAKVAESLQSAWSTKWVGDAPDVWVPESTAWVRTASGNAETEKMMPDLQPSIARSPVVIAMPKQMAEALGWPKTQLDWAELLDKFAKAKNGWQAYGKDWGPFKLGMTDPSTSTAGLLALSAIIDADDNQDIDENELGRLLQLKQVMKVYEPNTAQILRGFDGAGAGGLSYVSAFPALEQEVLAHNVAHPEAQLVAVYPKNNTEADNPYLTLTDTPWTDAKRQAVAGGFLAYLRSPAARAVLQEAGFRDPNRRAGATITQANGVLAELTALPRGVLLTDAVNNTLNTWTSLTRPTNMLLVLDVSGSMSEKVPGLGRAKLDLTKDAAIVAVKRFDDTASVGLWSFSSSQGGKPYRELVPLTKLGGEMADGTKGADKVLSEIKGLKAGGNTGMYDTIAAAHAAVQAKYQADATNLVVILTDGANDDQGKGLSLEQLTKKLKDADPKRPVKVVTIALGQQANGTVLQQISAATGAPTPFVSRDQYDITAVLLRAIFQTR